MDGSSCPIIFFKSLVIVHKIVCTSDSREKKNVKLSPHDYRCNLDSSPTSTKKRPLPHRLRLHKSQPDDKPRFLLSCTANRNGAKGEPKARIKRLLTQKSDVYGLG